MEKACSADPFGSFAPATGPRFLRARVMAQPSPARIGLRLSMVSEVWSWERYACHDPHQRRLQIRAPPSLGRFPARRGRKSMAVVPTAKLPLACAWKRIQSPRQLLPGNAEPVLHGGGIHPRLARELDEFREHESKGFHLGRFVQPIGSILRKKRPNVEHEFRVQKLANIRS